MKPTRGGKREGAGRKTGSGHKQMATAARYIHGPESEKHNNATRAASAILYHVRSSEQS